MRLSIFGFVDVDNYQTNFLRNENNLDCGWWSYLRFHRPVASVSKTEKAQFEQNSQQNRIQCHQSKDAVVSH